MDNLPLDNDLIQSQQPEGKSLQDLLTHGYSTQSVEYIKQGFEIFKQNAFGFIGYLFVIGIAVAILGMIPFVKMIVSSMAAPFLVGGFIVADKIAKGEPNSFSNFFDGTKKFKDLFLSTFIMYLIFGVIYLVIAGWPMFKISFLGIRPNYGSGSLNDILQMSQQMSAYAGRSMLASLALMLVSLFFIFSSLLIWFANHDAIKSLDVSRKLVTKKYLNWLGFFLLIVLLNFAGAICLLVGLFITIPTSICAMYVAYKDVTGLYLKD
jgi:hypothetical protein